MTMSYDIKEYYKVCLFVDIASEKENDFILKQREFSVINAEESTPCAPDGKALKTALVNVFPAGPASMKANILKPMDSL